MRLSFAVTKLHRVWASILVAGSAAQYSQRGFSRAERAERILTFGVLQDDIGCVIPGQLAYVRLVFTVGERVVCSVRGD